MAEKEEYMYCAVYADCTVKFCREDDILQGSVLQVSDAAYYARLPLTAEKGAWHVASGKLTPKGYGRRIVLFQQPAYLNGYPLVDFAAEANVERCYARLRQEAREALSYRAQCVNSAYKFEPDKSLTYAYLWELPKFKREREGSDYRLEPLESNDFGEVISFLEMNFASEKAIEQYYRNNAPDDPSDCGIGAIHGD